MAVLLEGASPVAFEGPQKPDSFHLVFLGALRGLQAPAEGLDEKVDGFWSTLEARGMPRWASAV